MVDPQIKSQWHQSFFYATSAASPDRFGQPTFAAAVQVTEAKVERRFTRVAVEVNGVSLALSHQILTDVDVPEGSQVWIEGTNPTDNPDDFLVCHMAAPHEDEWGDISHYELSLRGAA